MNMKIVKNHERENEDEEENYEIKLAKQFERRERDQKEFN